jgi:hypothetical protein
VIVLVVVVSVVVVGVVVLVVLVVVGVVVEVVEVEEVVEVAVLEVGVVVAVVWWHCRLARSWTVEPPWLRLALSVVLIVPGRLVTELLKACEALTAAAQLPEPTAAWT